MSPSMIMIAIVFLRITLLTLDFVFDDYKQIECSTVGNTAQKI